MSVTSPVLEVLALVEVFLGALEIASGARTRRATVAVAEVEGGRLDASGVSLGVFASVPGGVTAGAGWDRSRSSRRRGGGGASASASGRRRSRRNNRGGCSDSSRGGGSSTSGSGGGRDLRSRRADSGSVRGGEVEHQAFVDDVEVTRVRRTEEDAESIRALELEGQRSAGNRDRCEVDGQGDSVVLHERDGVCTAERKDKTVGRGTGGKEKREKVSKKFNCAVTMSSNDKHKDTYVASPVRTGIAVPSTMVP